MNNDFSDSNSDASSYKNQENNSLTKNRFEKAEHKYSQKMLKDVSNGEIKTGLTPQTTVQNEMCRLSSKVILQT